MTRSHRTIVGGNRRSSARRAFVGALCVGLAMGALRSAAGAQSPATASVARISGVVRDKASGVPIASAQLLLVTEGRLVESDSTGHYIFPGLPVGRVHLRVRARSYPQAELVVVLREGDDLQIPIALDSTARTGTPQELAVVAVTAAAPIGNYRLNDFERRKRTGIGQYLTDDEIQRSGAANVQD
ncbi:MAG: carboxypeptidase-like regulatory domain-containing protein, partial [Gemmatimonadota bacterium]|nr:carboxypeptidase-like regulatory domain-containing protein [Gemmatimonadota bacterium]